MQAQQREKAYSSNKTLILAYKGQLQLNILDWKIFYNLYDVTEQQTVKTRNVNARSIDSLTVASQFSTPWLDLT